MPGNMRQRLMMHHGWYQRVPCEPAPDQLAQTLKQANVHKAAVRQIDSFDRYAERHAEHKAQLIRGICGVAAIGLGLSPALPGTYRACHTDDWLDCSLKVGAMVGGMLAIAIGIWGATELLRHPVKMGRQADKMSAALEREQQRKAGHAPVPDLLQHYRRMSRTERLAFKVHLHEHVKAPRTPHDVEAAEGDELA